jgi:hypothetical protein
MKRSLTAHAAALALLLVVGAGARADQISPDQVQWTYNFTPGAPAVLADGNPSAGVTFTNEPTKTATGSSDVVATNLRVFSAASAQAPDVLSSNGAYSLALTLTSVQNGQTFTQSFTFFGKLAGTFSADNSNVTNVFNTLGVHTLTLGAYSFAVQLVAYTPPGPPDQSNAGSISAHVTVSTPNGGGGPQNSPEPSTILLSSLGLTFLGGAAWRKRRLARRQPA